MSNGDNPTPDTGAPSRPIDPATGKPREETEQERKEREKLEAEEGDK